MFRKYTQFLDISMVDETGYMELLNFNPLIYPGGYGPLYILSYKIVFQIVPDFIQLHYFFIITLTWLPAVAIFYFLRSRKVSFVVALLSSWLLFISTYIAAFDWWARTAHYSIFACFVFLIFTYRYKQKPIVFLAFAFFFLKILSYVRPELNVASYLILLLLLVLVIYKKVKKQELHINISFLEKSILGIFALVFLGMFLIWKSPTQNTGRLYFALGQHYKFNTIRWNNEERKEFIKYAGATLLTSNIGNVLSQIDMQLIIFLLGSAATGFYSNYLSLMNIPFMFISPILAFLFPVISELHGRSDNKSMTLIHERFSLYLSIIGIWVGFFLLQFGESLAVVFFGEAFRTS